MIMLTKDQAAVLLAFCESFEDVLTGCWAPVEKSMKETHGIEEPESALADAMDALRA